MKFDHILALSAQTNLVAPLPVRFVRNFLGHQVWELRWHDRVNLISKGRGLVESFRHVILIGGVAKLFNPDTGKIGKSLGTFSLAAFVGNRD